MATRLSPRIEYEIKELISDIAGQDRTISDTAADLIQVGIAVRKHGAEPEIRGPLGIPRPFAKISLGERTAELRTEVEDDVADELVNRFDNKRNTAAREALRLGILAVASEKFTVEGPVGEPRPFANIEVDTIDDPEIVALTKQLRNSL